MSDRIHHTDEPHIENILDAYAGRTDLLSLALGSSYWQPPEEAIARLLTDITSLPSIHRYGGILGWEPLREKLKQRLLLTDLDISQSDIIIYPGANEAFACAALVLCDQHDNAIVIAPYYFCHVVSLQLAGVHVTIAPFESSTLLPDWSQLQNSIQTLRPKMVVLK
jgi:aspartate aminotransferase